MPIVKDFIKAHWASVQQLRTGLSIQLTIHLPARQKDSPTLSLRWTSMFNEHCSFYCSAHYLKFSSNCVGSKWRTTNVQLCTLHARRRSVAIFNSNSTLILFNQALLLAALTRSVFYHSLLVIICALTFHDGLPPFVWWCTHPVAFLQSYTPPRQIGVGTYFPIYYL